MNALITQQETEQIEQNTNEKDTCNNNNDINDNGTYTSKPIVNLEEVEVATGHENDELLKEFEIRKLYR